jgi:hypothetical protein
MRTNRRLGHLRRGNYLGDVMERDVSIPLDGFARQTLWITARRHRLSPASVVAGAAAYFLADRDRGRPARLLPTFAFSESAPDEACVLSIGLDAQTWDDLESEASFQGVDVGLLLGHAALYLIADLNAGRSGAQGVVLGNRPRSRELSVPA